MIAILVAGAAVATPFASTQWTHVPGLLAMFSACMIVINLLLASLLFIKGRVEERRDTIRLGAAYFYVGLIIIPQTLSFPGALMPAPVFGTQETSLWFWIFWHTGFALSIIRYAWLWGRPDARPATLIRSIAGSLAAVGALTAIAAGCAEALPPLVVAGKFELAGAGLLIHALLCLVMLLALASVVRLRATVPENMWLLVGLVASCAEIWLTLHGSARFAVGWYLAKAGSLLTSLVVLVSLMHEITRLYSEAAFSNRTLATLARRDGLTGLSNRRHFDELFAQEFRRAARQELPLALVMIDVDRFKAFNDRYGHPAGDECLRGVCAAVASALRRPGDHAARYGGEEIAVLLPATDARGAMLIAETVRAAVARLAIEHLGGDTRVVTISSGVAVQIPFEGDSPGHLLSAADRALYRAKRAGRNCVVCATDDDLQLAPHLEHGMAPVS